MNKAKWRLWSLSWLWLIVQFAWMNIGRQILVMQTHALNLSWKVRRFIIEFKTLSFPEQANLALKITFQDEVQGCSLPVLRLCRWKLEACCWVEVLVQDLSSLIHLHARSYCIVPISQKGVRWWGYASVILRKDVSETCVMTDTWMVFRKLLWIRSLVAFHIDMGSRTRFPLSSTSRV